MIERISENSIVYLLPNLLLIDPVQKAPRAPPMLGAEARREISRVEASGKMCF